MRLRCTLSWSGSMMRSRKAVCIAAPPLADQPLVERALLEIETFKELAPTEHKGTGQRCRIPATHCILELTHIDDDPSSIEAQKIAFCQNGHGLTVLAPLAKRREALSQVLPG